MCPLYIASTFALAATSACRAATHHVMCNDISNSTSCSKGEVSSCHPPNSRRAVYTWQGKLPFSRTPHPSSTHSLRGGIQRGGAGLADSPGRWCCCRSLRRPKMSWEKNKTEQRKAVRVKVRKRRARHAGVCASSHPRSVAHVCMWQRLTQLIKR